MGGWCPPTGAFWEGQRLGRGGGGKGQREGHRPQVGGCPEILTLPSPTASRAVKSVNPGSPGWGAGGRGSCELVWPCEARPQAGPLCPPKDSQQWTSPAQPPGVQGPGGEKGARPHPRSLRSWGRLNFSPPPQTPASGATKVSAGGGGAATICTLLPTIPLAMWIARFTIARWRPGPAGLLTHCDRLTPHKRAAPDLRPRPRAREGRCRSPAGSPRSAQKNQNPRDGHQGQNRRQPSKCHPACGHQAPHSESMWASAGGDGWDPGRTEHTDPTPAQPARTAPRLLPTRWFPSAK